jgi:hypothetical protein
MVERRTIALVRADCDVARARIRKSTYVRTLYRACVILGGLAPLARHLGVAPERLRPWLAGREDPPDAVFLGAVEVLLLDAERSGTPS